MKKMTRAGKTAIEIGAGLAAAGAAAAAAGYYFYSSDNAKKHRKIAATWATDMKKKVVKEVKHLGNVSPKAFATIVDNVAKTYQTAKKVDVADLKRATNELKANWDMVQRETKRTARKSIATAKTATKRIVKKSVSHAKATVKKVAKKAAKKRA
jgi:hypothetical protein